MAQSVVGSSVTASQLKDLFRQIDDGSLNGVQVQAFLEHRDPFAKTGIGLADYWKTRKGLWVSDSFTDRVLPYANGDNTGDISSCDHIDLPRNMYDSEIIAEYLGGMEEAKKHAFTLNQLRTFIDTQWNGEEGRLLVNGYANIFYVTGKDGNLFAVGVFWVADDRVWYVRGWSLDELGYWSAGLRLFRNKR